MRKSDYTVITMWDELPQFLKIPELYKKLGLSKNLVYNTLLKDRAFPLIKDLRVIDKDDLRKYMEKKKQYART